MAQSKEYYRAYYLKNRERILERTKAHQKKTRHKRRIWARAWRAKNKERVNAYLREWGQRRRDAKHPKYLASYRNKPPEAKARIYKRWRESPQGRAYRKKYEQENKELFRRLWRAKRARRLNAPGSYTTDEWEGMKRDYCFTCPCCHRAEPEITLTVDHIIPLSLGGSNSIDNFQPLCNSCNSRKRTKIIRFTPAHGIVQGFVQ